ncbi:MAG TPA: Gfo/Idh/MocA family oxidoreductase [Acidimicrobiales bacterium]|nr:Gfo/Idh/MocA family oxidoreductase [Acidimicrobiales bacterium]
MRAVLVGAGAVGARAARQLRSTESLTNLVVVDIDARRAELVCDSLGEPARVGAVGEWGTNPDVVVLTCPGDHRRLAEEALERGAHVVSAADDMDEVRALLDLDAEARERGRVVVTGAGFSPGLTCLLARHAASAFDVVDEVHVAKAGTGGPACARTHHDALGSWAVDWRDGGWLRRPGGSGRELAWFPDPVGGQDCYRAALPDAYLLVPAFPGARRVTARMAATRRDRLTARLPMLRPPHPEGVIGAVRVEVRGQRGSGRDARVLGAVERPAIAAGMVAAVAALWAVDDRLARRGAGGLGELVEDAVPFLQELARRGVRAAVFEGANGDVRSAGTSTG